MQDDDNEINAEAVMIGVLIEIPKHMLAVYEYTAQLTGDELSTIIARDCNDVCQRYFRQMEKLNERQNSETGSKES